MQQETMSGEFFFTIRAGDARSWPMTITIGYGRDRAVIECEDRAAAEDVFVAVKAATNLIFLTSDKEGLYRVLLRCLTASERDSTLSPVLELGAAATAIEAEIARRPEEPVAPDDLPEVMSPDDDDDED